MSASLAHRLQETHSALCTACSVCGAQLPVFALPPGTTLLELRCQRCGTHDVYHVNTLRPFAESAHRG